ncbi:MAG: molybdate ABC transporter substrate-binding protein [Deltaproteobacteria bacterium]|nr:molybdate ABC transporter substrate-binding protein [Deltaproteobacteria bacterium]
MIRRWCILVLLLMLALPLRPGRGTAAELRVAAAADLQFAFTEVGEAFRRATGHRVTFVFGSTGLLYHQIVHGAPYDVFAAADVDRIEQLRARGLIVEGSQQVYAQGRIGIAVSRGTVISVERLEDLASPAVTRVAIANPEHAPYGVAAKEALINAGLWERVRGKLVYGENVRQVLQYVESGNIPAGIVPLSLARSSGIRFTLLDAKLHRPLVQALAVIRTTRQEAAARSFIAFVNGPSGRPILRRYGFLLPGEF